MKLVGRQGPGTDEDGVIGNDECIVDDEGRSGWMQLDRRREGVSVWRKGGIEYAGTVSSSGE